jgi:hypothetical protein
VGPAAALVGGRGYRLRIARNKATGPHTAASSRPAMVGGTRGGPTAGPSTRSSGTRPRGPRCGRSGGRSPTPGSSSRCASCPCPPASWCPAGGSPGGPPGGAPDRKGPGGHPTGCATPTPPTPSSTATPRSTSSRRPSATRAWPPPARTCTPGRRTARRATSACRRPPRPGQGAPPPVPRGISCSPTTWPFNYVPPCGRHGWRRPDASGQDRGGSATPPRRASLKGNRRGRPQPTSGSGRRAVGGVLQRGRAAAPRRARRKMPQRPHDRASREGVLPW